MNSCVSASSNNLVNLESLNIKLTELSIRNLNCFNLFNNYNIVVVALKKTRDTAYQ